MSWLRLALLHLLAVLAGPWLAASAAAMPPPAHALHAMTSIATVADGAAMQAPEAGPPGAVAAACGDQAVHGGHAPAGDCCDPGTDECAAACAQGAAAAPAASTPPGSAGTPGQRPDARLHAGHLTPSLPLLLRPPIA